MCVESFDGDVFMETVLKTFKDLQDDLQMK